MTVRNTVVDNEQTNITFTQDTNLGVGSDKRRWSAEKDGDRYVFWVTDDYKVAKSVNGGIPVFSLEIGTTGAISSTNKITLCFDRDLVYGYAIHVNNFFSTVAVHRITISDMSLNTVTGVNGTGGVTPLKAQITPQGDKIVWLGSNNNTLYKMDLDGSGLESAIGDNEDTFCITSDGVAFSSRLVSDSLVLKRILLSDMSETQALNFSYPLKRFSKMIIFNGFIYAIVNDFSRIFKIPIESWNVVESWISVELVGITTVTKFNLAYDGSNHYGILCENNGSDRKHMWKVDLDTLALQGLREVSKVNNSGIKTLTAEFASSGTMATIDTDGSNDDWTGCDRVTVFS